MYSEGKGQWEAPELTVMVRTRPEEAVMCAAACKTHGGGEKQKFGGCKYQEGNPKHCTTACQGSGNS